MVAQIRRLQGLYNSAKMSHASKRKRRRRVQFNQRAVSKLYRSVETHIAPALFIGRFNRLHFASQIHPGVDPAENEKPEIRHVEQRRRLELWIQNHKC